MSANFNYYLNRQGLRGRKGEKGDPGEGVTVEVGQNTANTFTLLITTQDGTFETPNLRGSLINTTGAGTYLRYDRDTDSIYVASIDEATNSSSGIVRIATSEEIEARDGDGVIQANQLSEILVNNDTLTALPLTKISSTVGNYAGYTIDLENATKYPTYSVYNTTATGASNTITYNSINGGKFGVNADNTGFDSGNTYIEFPFEEGKMVGGVSRTNMFGCSPTFIFGNSDGSVFRPLFFFHYTSVSNFIKNLVCGKISSFTDNSITLETRYNYAGVQHAVSDFGGVTYPAGLISLSEGSGGNATISGLFTHVGYGESGVTPAVFTDLQTFITNDELLSINAVRMYEACYPQPGTTMAETCSTPLTYVVMGEVEDGPSSIDTLNDVLLIGTYELGEYTTNRLTLKYDTNTLGVNGSGALYAKLGTVDDDLSTVSENPVQNKVITTRVNSIAGDVSSLQTSVGNLQSTIDGGEV